MNPLLLDFPESFDTERLTIRAPRAGDGAELNAAILESLPELRAWMPWAHTPPPSLEESETNIRGAAARFITREELRLLLFLKGTGTMVGSSGLSRMDWKVPYFEIGYWIRTSQIGHGYATEAVVAITAFAREYLQARRLAIIMDARNEASWRVAERAGFPLEATLRNERMGADGVLSDTRIYAKIF